MGTDKYLTFIESLRLRRITMSADLLWSIVRKNSCFLVKSQGLTLTKEPNNLKSVNSFKYNGLVNKKTVGLDAVPTGKGVTLTLRKAKGQNKVRKSLKRTTLQGSRHAVRVIRNTLNSGSYRKDLVDTAVRRACAIVRSQNASVVKKRRSRRKKN